MMDWFNKKTTKPIPKNPAQEAPRKPPQNVQVGFYVSQERIIERMQMVNKIQKNSQNPIIKELETEILGNRARQEASQMDDLDENPKQSNLDLSEDEQRMILINKILKDTERKEVLTKERQDLFHVKPIIPSVQKFKEKVMQILVE